MDFLRGIKETKVKPFRGGPKTVMLTDRDGVAKGVRVQPKYLTPLGAIVADATAKLLTVGLVSYSILTVLEMPEPNWVVPALMPLAYVPLRRTAPRRR
ncbi:hypothetical protein SAMN06265173_1604 [Thalassovita litoralis]|uniref:Uncharacterized protein n=1 Tax=Thalassovita litoralis TaxID=1010611 RepID=A0A521FU66_9RHOB|nr:hypothetical protein [Thalassovita litoralis]SMO99739.1 hypothetical protein SAMN06265173_1604 [Thalassovita litoralis]